MMCPLGYLSVYDFSSEKMDVLMLLADELQDEDLLMLLQGVEEDEAGDQIDHRQYPRLDLAKLSNSQIKKYFRFDEADILHLVELLNMPDHIVCGNRVHTSGIEALCITLRRLAYPSRYCDMIPLFGRSRGDLCEIFNHTIEFIHTRFSVLVSSYDLPWVRNNITTFTRAIHDKGAPLNNCWAFVDGTLRPMCRPGHNQAECFNGHKRCHGLKFQGMTTPDGLIFNLMGPFEGRRHDSFMLHESDTVNDLNAIQGNNGEHVCIYGDPAYPLQDCLMKPFPTVNINPEQEEFNKDMSKVRQAVEWSFGKVITIFAFLDFKKNLKLYMSPIAKYYIVGTILTNCHTCIYGSQVGEYFGLAPPSIEEYLGFVNR